MAWIVWCLRLYIFLLSIFSTHFLLYKFAISLTFSPEKCDYSLSHLFFLKLNFSLNLFFFFLPLLNYFGYSREIHKNLNDSQTL